MITASFDISLGRNPSVLNYRRVIDIQCDTLSALWQVLKTRELAQILLHRIPRL